MGHVKEIEGIDLIVAPMLFTDEDRQAISAIIAHYKSTGEIIKFEKKSKRKNKNSTLKNTRRTRTNKSMAGKKLEIENSLLKK